MTRKSETSVIIVGLCRNVEKSLEREVNRISRQLMDLGIQYNFFLVESDSDDLTTEKLLKLKTYFSNFDYVTLGSLSEKLPCRIERLSYCRNLYVSEIRSNPYFLKKDYVLVVDFDIRNSALNLGKLFRFVNSTHLSWDALACNQRGRYFDIYALRAKNWSSSDCFLELNMLSKNMSRKRAKEVSIWNKMRYIPKNSNPIAVDSAFGGMALYKIEVFRKYKYEFVPESSFVESEHVGLHVKIRSEGGQIYIVPSFTNFYWNPHNLSSFRTFRLLDSFSRRLLPKFIRKILRRALD